MRSITLTTYFQGKTVIITIIINVLLPLSNSEIPIISTVLTTPRGQRPTTQTFKVLPNTTSFDTTQNLRFSTQLSLNLLTTW